MGTVHSRKFAALAALALLLTSICAAEAGNEFGVAVIIGNKAYQDDRVPDVDYAHNDADAFYKFVVGPLGFSSDNVVDLRDATKASHGSRPSASFPSCPHPSPCGVPIAGIVPLPALYGRA